MVLLLGLGGVACSDSTSPSINGPPLLQAYIDQVPWIPSGPVHSGSALSDVGDLSIFGDKVDAAGLPREVVTLAIVDFHGPGSYALRDQGTGSFGLYRKADALGVFSDFLTRSTVPGRLDVTAIDSVTHMVAGTFAFVASAGTSSGGTHRLTGGRFRLPYTPVHP